MGIHLVPEICGCGQAGSMHTTGKLSCNFNVSGVFH